MALARHKGKTNINCVRRFNVFRFVCVCVCLNNDFACRADKIKSSVQECLNKNEANPFDVNDGRNINRIPHSGRLAGRRDCTESEIEFFVRVQCSLKTKRNSKTKKTKTKKKNNYPSKTRRQTFG